jgi:hypothetical protein
MEFQYHAMPDLYTLTVAAEKGEFIPLAEAAEYYAAHPDSPEAEVLEDIALRAGMSYALADLEHTVTSLKSVPTEGLGDDSGSNVGTFEQTIHDAIEQSRTTMSTFAAKEGADNTEVRVAALNKMAKDIRESNLQMRDGYVYYASMIGEFEPNAAHLRNAMAYTTQTLTEYLWEAVAGCREYAEDVKQVGAQQARSMLRDEINLAVTKTMDDVKRMQGLLNETVEK